MRAVRESVHVRRHMAWRDPAILANSDAVAVKSYCDTSVGVAGVDSSFPNR